MRVFASSASGLLALVLAAGGLAGCGSTWSVVDVDGDGFSPAQGDCWDAEAGPEGSGLSGVDIHPGAADTWYDGIDQDCAGNDDFDADGDGWVPEEAMEGRLTLGVPGSGAHKGDGDCWDAPAGTVDAEHEALNGLDQLLPEQVNPEATEDVFYDGIDAACDGGDEFDADGDGYPSDAMEDRDGATGDDCDDTAAAVNPGVELESCNDIDDDCDGLVDGEDDDVDPDDVRTWYADGDGDGYGLDGTAELSCSALPGHVQDENTDCDDDNDAINPGAQEVCNDVDDDCDADIDDADDSVDATQGGVEAWTDGDGDGYGDPFSGAWFCEAPAGTVDNTLDCDDSDAGVSPDAAEVCDGADNDCDGAIDDDDDSVDLSTGSTWYTDGDGDGFGDAAAPVQACLQPSGTVTDATDCDDATASTNPGATEGPGDEVDSDCDGGETCYVDGDGDGYRPDSSSTVASADVDCTDAGEAVTGAPVDDCDDGDAAINPGAAEVTGDEVDSDCDGGETCYVDGDGDGYASDDGATVASADSDCGDAGEAPSSAPRTDCDDAEAAVNPGASEVTGDEVDGDCNGSETCYTDGDGDGYASDDGFLTVSADSDCADAGEATAAVPRTDCDDGDSAVNPGATELTDDGTDNDCDGAEQCYVDDDDDGYAETTGAVIASADLDCTDPGEAGASDPATDCDDAAADVNPGEAEVCNDGLDNDCDAATECAIAAGSVTGAHLKWVGQDNNHRIGSLTAIVPDLDGDGVDDLLIGAPEFDTTAGGTDRGALYLQRGLDTRTDVNTTGESAVANAGGLRLAGLNAAGANAGYAADAGDIDGDGVADLVIGSPGLSSDSGGSYLLMGPITAGGNQVLPALVSSGGAVLRTGDFDQDGTFVQVGGDVDGDGTGDVAVSSIQSSAYGSTDTGAGQVVLLTGAAIAADGYEAATALVVGGVATGDATGTSLAFIDLDGSGVDDLVVGAPGDDTAATNGGSTWVVAGPISGSATLGTQPSLQGAGAGDALGQSVANVGDLDGDGLDELLVGVPNADPSGTNDGQALVVQGGATVLSGGAGSLSAWLTITGDSSGDRLGVSVAPGGDIDGDGALDLVLGAWLDADGGANAGAAYLAYGPFTAGSLSAGAATVTKLTGEDTANWAGIAVGGGGDVNDDGFDDVLVGAPQYDVSGNQLQGAAYLFLGLGQ